MGNEVCRDQAYLSYQALDYNKGTHVKEDAINKAYFIQVYIIANCPSVLPSAFYRYGYAMLKPSMLSSSIDIRRTTDSSSLAAG